MSSQINMSITETCACGASITVSSWPPAVASVVMKWRVDHRHEMPAPVEKPDEVEKGMRRHRTLMVPAVLVEVAEVYREAWASGAAPTKAVAEHFHKSHSTAARWVGLARKAGRLGLADGSRGGEVA